MQGYLSLYPYLQVINLLQKALDSDEKVSIYFEEILKFFVLQEVGKFSIIKVNQ